MKKEFLEKKVNPRIIPVLIIVVLLAGTVCRFLYMTADPPTDLTISGSILGDPGLYSYAARNMVLFEQRSFGGYDNHAGTLFMSYMNYFVYKTFGISFVTHRIFPVLFSIFAMLLFAFLVYKYLGKYACLFTSIFAAFNYPLLMYSRSANRQFPMLFFFLISLLFFIEGSKRQKNIFFFFSLLFFALSYLSKGSILYLAPVYLLAGILWLIEKRIKLRHLLTFFISFAVFMALWRFFVYLPNRHFLDALISHNKAIGSISSVSHLLYNLLHHPLKIIGNILNSPFMLQFRSEPVLFFITLFALFIYLYDRLSNFKSAPSIKEEKKPRHGEPIRDASQDKIPMPGKTSKQAAERAGAPHPRRKDTQYILDIAFLWVLVVIGKNALFTYRPVRNYLDLIFPTALLAGWVLQKFLDREIKFKPGLFFFLSLAAAALLFFPFGIVKYLKYFGRTFAANPVFAALNVIVFLVFLAALFWRRRKTARTLLLIVLFSFSLFSNFTYFNKWAKNRSYQLVNISGVLGKAIPPGYIAGNWIILLATGTPHKTTLAWPGQINWQADFLERNKVEYVMISDFSIDGYRAYRRLFKKELDNAELLAIFRLHKKNLYFFKLEPAKKPGRLEGETFYRDNEKPQVVYGADFSNKMGLTLPAQPEKTHNLKREFSTAAGGGVKELVVRARGSFLARIEIRGQDSVLFQKGFMVKSEDFTEKSFALDVLEAAGLQVKIKVYKIREDSLLDFIEFR